MIFLKIIHKRSELKDIDWFKESKTLSGSKGFRDFE